MTWVKARRVDSAEFDRIGQRLTKHGVPWTLGQLAERGLQNLYDDKTNTVYVRDIRLDQPARQGVPARVSSRRSRATANPQADDPHTN